MCFSLHSMFRKWYFDQILLSPSSSFDNSKLNIPSKARKFVHNIPMLNSKVITVSIIFRFTLFCYRVSTTILWQALPLKEASSRKQCCKERHWTYSRILCLPVGFLYPTAFIMRILSPSKISQTNSQSGQNPKATPNQLDNERGSRYNARSKVY